MFENGWVEKKEFWTKKGEYGTWIWGKEKKRDIVNKNKSICIDCRHHIIVNKQIVCYAKSTSETDYVTGITEAKDVRNCYDLNKNGECPDFEKRTKKNDYPKHVFGGTVDSVRQQCAVE